MTKKFIKDNRGQVLYAVLVAVIFIGVLSMITMGLTLKNYQAAVQKQQRVSDYYAADAVAELIRIKELKLNSGETVELDGDTYVNLAEYAETHNPKRVIVVTHTVENNGNDGTISEYTIKTGTVTLVAIIDTENNQFKSWEVSYHAVETQPDDQAQ